MSSLAIDSSQGRYGISIGEDGLAHALSEAAVIVVDGAVADSLPESSAPTISVGGGEATKTLSGCESILVALKDLGIRRGDLLVAVGGGTVQDAATFVASFYMRGLPWAYCPSTAMAMTDSCIGGKSSINVAGIKNLGGNIYPPTSVAINTALADSLSIPARVCGLAEAVKICFARDRESFDSYLDLAVSPAEFGSGSQTEQLVLHTLRAKKWFVEIDEFDKRERQLLNFGHTFGHALEAASGLQVPHGIGVALGMMAALRHPASAHTTATRELEQYCVSIINPVRAEVATATASVDWHAFDRAVDADKKGTREAFRLVLPTPDDELALVALARTKAEAARIQESMRSVVSDLAA